MTENASQNDKPLFTHRAWIQKTEFVRKGRRIGPWIDEGSARVEPDGDVVWVSLHSLPIGGFDGRICLAKTGIDPNDRQAPQRPGETTDDGGDDTDSGEDESEG